jgi:hypothetical protein
MRHRSRTAMRHRSLPFWIAVSSVTAALGLALDKGFADNTPPYDEPTIAIVGFSLFLLSGFVVLVLCAVALGRWSRALLRNRAGLPR